MERYGLVRPRIVLRRLRLVVRLLTCPDNADGLPSVLSLRLRRLELRLRRRPLLKDVVLLLPAARLEPKSKVPDRPPARRTAVLRPLRLAAVPVKVFSVLVVGPPVAATAGALTATELPATEIDTRRRP